MNKEALDVLSHQLVAVLAEALPGLSDDWWQERVIDKLSFQQQGFIQTARIAGLEQLDLAALLRILDQNWHEIAGTRAMPVAVRNWVKEAQTIRNRWAHAPTKAIPNEDVYRDLDTIERLAQTLGAPDPDLEPLGRMKSEVMAALSGNSPPATQTTSNEPSGVFKPGAVVRLKAKPTITGAIIAHLPGDPEDRYQVFHDGTVTIYYASQLESVATTPARASVRPETLHAALSALQLRHPSTGSLYSLFASRVNFVPYQFRPVLKLIQADRPRLLIADEVGVGKTTFASLINRTRRRDIGNFTTRKPETVSVDYTPEQDTLHRDLIQLIGRMLARRHGDQNLQFMLTTVRRQVASCVFGLAPLLSDILNRHLSQVQLSEMGDEDNPDEIGEVLADFRAEVEALIRGARALTGPDPKFDAFLKVIRDKQSLPNNKLLVFSTFRHTLAYLVENLARASIRLGLIHGDIPDDERRELRHRFSLNKEDSRALDVLLSSEVGCEGLDFQFCDGLVNYDLPWNPMRVEQRIGRIDRYGQKSETAAIYNFITPGTVDAEIYERCLVRIGVFRQALGGSEEILGKLTREIHAIAENLELTDEERAARLQQLADNEIRVIQEQAKLEEEQTKLFGLALPKRDEDMVKQASSFWLAPVMLANLVARYLEALGVTSLPTSLGRKPVVTLQLGQGNREKLLADFQSLSLTGAAGQTWLRWLKGNDPYLALTFDPTAASERRDLAFITPIHPLARQAAQSVEPATPLVCNLRVEAADLSPGRYPFAIYRWRKIGLREDFTFQPVCADPAIAARMLEMLETAAPLDSPVQDITADEERALETNHYRLWIDLRAAHIEQVTQTTQARLASLNTTHTARLALLEEQRDNASDARIRRMKESQIETARRDYERRADELKMAPGQADVIAEAVAFGVLVMEGEK